MQQYDRTIAVLTDRHACFRATFAEFARRVQDEQRLDETFVDHAATHQSLGGTILHVLYHNVEHRSEVRHMLTRLESADLSDDAPQDWELAIGHV